MSEFYVECSADSFSKNFAVEIMAFAAPIRRESLLTAAIRRAQAMPAEGPNQVRVRPQEG
jgi:hypothetical protein